MKQSGAAGRLATLRLLAQRSAFFSLVAAAAALMILGKADIVLVERTRMLVVDALAPVLDAMSRPAATVAEFADGVRELASLRAENARLKEENAQLLNWQTVARRLGTENAVLHQQLNVIPDPDPAFVTARVLGEMGSAFGRSMLLFAGERDGVRKGQAVLAGDSMVGYIIEVGQRTSRMLLITDLNAHIPVTIESTRTRAILTGASQERPRLSYIVGSPPVSVGDRVVTSGSGGAFPPGIPVGTIASIIDGTIRVEPFVHSHQLEFVVIVDYGLGGIVPFDRPPPPRHRGGGN